MVFVLDEADKIAREESTSEMSMPRPSRFLFPSTPLWVNMTFQGGA